MTDNTRINANQNFSEIAAQLHEQFEKEGSGGGIRFDGKGLYVKGNSEFVDKHIAWPGQLGARFEKFNAAAQSLSDAIDREYQGLTVDGKSMSEYVFGNMLEDGGVHRLDEEALIALELRVQEGLSIAYTNALGSGDPDTVELLKDRQRYLDDAVLQTGDPAAAEHAAGWRSAVVEYRVLRDALADSLEETMGGLSKSVIDSLDHEADLDEERMDAYRFQADEILATIGGRRLCLDESSVNKVLAALHERPEFKIQDNRAAFELADGLRDKIRMNNSIDVNGKHLSSLNTELAEVIHDVSPLQAALTENKNLIEGLERVKVKGVIFDDATAKEYSDRLNANAIRIHNLREEYLLDDLIRVGGDEHSNAERTVSSTMAELAAGTYDLAKSLLQEGERTDRQIGVSANQPFAMESGALQQDDVRNLFRGDEALGARLGIVTSLYRNPAYQGGNGTAAFGQAINAHNENLQLLKDLHQAYLADPGMEMLDNVRGALDSALGSYYDLSANLQKIGQSKLQSAGALMDGEADTLREQGVALQKLSFLVDATKQTMLNDPQPVRGVSIVSDVSDMFGLPGDDFEIGADDGSGPASLDDVDFMNAGKPRSDSVSTVEDLFTDFRPVQEEPDREFAEINETDIPQLDLISEPLIDAGAMPAEDEIQNTEPAEDSIDFDNDVADEMLNDLPDPNEFVARAQAGTPGGPGIAKVGFVDDKAPDVSQGQGIAKKSDTEKRDADSQEETDEVPPFSAKV